MVAIIGYSGWGLEPFYSITSPINKINQLEGTKCTIDEINVRERIDISCSNVKDVWRLDNLMLCRFLGSLEAGNTDASGLQIVKFIIKRRKINELNNIILGYRNFSNNTTMQYIDNTQTNDEYIYSVVPLAINQLEGKPNEVNHQSSFTGWFIVDKINNENTITCDKFIDNELVINLQQNEGRVLIETFSQFPQIYKTPKKYHQFTLTCTVALENENINSFSEYQKVLNLIDNNTPFLIKSGSGDVYICELSNPRKSSPLNTHRGRDYFTVEIDCIEVMSAIEYQKLYVGGDA